MAAFLYPLLLIIFLGMFFSLWRTRRKDGTRTTGGLILQGVLFALIYDAFILSIGRWSGDDVLLQRLSLGRHLIFAIFTPLLMVAGLDFARRAEVFWAQKRFFQIIIWLGTISLIAVETLIEWGLQEDWVLDSSFGIVRFVHENGLPPFGMILASLVLSILGGLIWRKIKWAWVFVGGVVMLVGSVIPTAFVGSLAVSVAEVVLLGCLVATEKRLLTPNYSLSDSELDLRFGQVAERSKKK